MDDMVSSIGLAVTFHEPIQESAAVLFLGIAIQRTIHLKVSIVSESYIEETGEISQVVFHIENENGRIGKVHRSLVNVVVIAWSLGAIKAEPILRWIEE